MTLNLSNKKTNKKRRRGVVVSNRGMKTIVVEVLRRKPHKLYGKILKKTNRFLVHDSKEEAQLKDVVLFEETRPISKHKCARLVKIIEKSQKYDL